MLSYSCKQTFLYCFIAILTEETPSAEVLRTTPEKGGHLSKPTEFGSFEFAGAGGSSLKIEANTVETRSAFVPLSSHADSMTTPSTSLSQSSLSLSSALSAPMSLSSTSSSASLSSHSTSSLPAVDAEKRQKEGGEESENEDTSVTSKSASFPSFSVDTGGGTAAIAPFTLSFNNNNNNNDDNSDNNNDNNDR